LRRWGGIHGKEDERLQKFREQTDHLSAGKYRHSEIDIQLQVFLIPAWQDAFQERESAII
jgi:hypothetical protein